MSQELCRAGIDLCLPSREFLIVGAQRRASEVREKVRGQASLILLGKLVYIRQQVGQRLHGITLDKTRDSVNLLDERFGSGDGEREASMTGQMPFGPLSDPVLLNKAAMRQGRSGARGVDGCARILGGLDRLWL